MKPREKVKWLIFRVKMVRVSTSTRARIHPIQQDWNTSTTKRKGCSKDLACSSGEKKDLLRETFRK